MRNDMVWVGLGGFLGALSRYYAGLLLTTFFPPPFPAATFLINISGSFVLGLLLTFLAERPRLNACYRLFGATGFLGAYTTFSSFSYEVVNLAQRRLYLTFGLYWLGSLVVGLVCVGVGVAVARLLSRQFPAVQDAAIVLEPDAEEGNTTYLSPPTSQ